MPLSIDQALVVSLRDIDPDSFTMSHGSVIPGLVCWKCNMTGMLMSQSPSNNPTVSTLNESEHISVNIINCGCDVNTD